MKTQTADNCQSIWGWSIKKERKERKRARRTGIVGRSAGQSRVLAGRRVYGRAVGAADGRSMVLLTLTVPRVRGVSGGSCRVGGTGGSGGSERWQTGRSRRFTTNLLLLRLRLSVQSRNCWIASIRRHQPVPKKKQQQQQQKLEQNFVVIICPVPFIIRDDYGWL